ncbi:MAG: PAS domain-containing protein [Actinobacteria bacterium]|nr:PAS domain-containing protein [Actinomycetota bacterium]
MDQLADAVLVADTDGHYVEANLAAATLLGSSRAELLSMGVADVTMGPLGGLGPSTSDSPKMATGEGWSTSAGRAIGWRERSTARIPPSRCRSTASAACPMSSPSRDDVGTWTRSRSARIFPAASGSSERRSIANPGGYRVRRRPSQT